MAHWNNFVGNLDDRVDLGNVYKENRTNEIFKLPSLVPVNGDAQITKKMSALMALLRCWVIFNNERRLCMYIPEMDTATYRLISLPVGSNPFPRPVNPYNYCRHLSF